MGDKNIQKIYDDVSQFYDKERTKTYFKKILSFLLKNIPKYSSVLDVGGGTGKFSVELSKRGYKVCGFDFSKKMVQTANKNIRNNKVKCVYRYGDAEENIPFKGNFDFAISIDSWEFFTNPLKVLNNVHSKLKAGGTFIIITPNPYVSLPIIIAEKLGIKKVHPTYLYFSSFKHKIKLWAKETGFSLETRNWLYYGVGQAFFLKRKS